MLMKQEATEGCEVLAPDSHSSLGSHVHAVAGVTEHDTHVGACVSLVCRVASGYLHHANSIDGQTHVQGSEVFHV